MRRKNFHEIFCEPCNIIGVKNIDDIKTNETFKALCKMIYIEGRFKGFIEGAEFRKEILEAKE